MRLIKVGLRENEGLIWKNQYCSLCDTGVTAASGIRAIVFYWVSRCCAEAGGSRSPLPRHGRGPGEPAADRAGGDRDPVIAGEVTSTP